MRQLRAKASSQAVHSAYAHATVDVQKVVDGLEGDEKTGAKIILKALRFSVPHRFQTQV